MFRTFNNCTEHGKINHGKAIAGTGRVGMILHMEVRVWAALSVPTKNPQAIGFSYKTDRGDRVFQTALVQSLAATQKYEC